MGVVALVVVLIFSPGNLLHLPPRSNCIEPGSILTATKGRKNIVPCPEADGETTYSYYDDRALWIHAFVIAVLVGFAAYFAPTAAAALSRL